MLEYDTVRMIDLQAWDHLVEETYGRAYTFQQQDGCKGRGTETFEVPCEPWDYDNDTVQKIPEDKGYHTGMFWTRSFYPSLEMVAQDLYEKGLIEEGSYTINIDW